MSEKDNGKDYGEEADIRSRLGNICLLKKTAANCRNVLEGYLFEENGYCYAIYYSDSESVRLYVSDAFENRKEALFEMEEMIRYFPLWGFSSRYLIHRRIPQEGT